MPVRTWAPATMPALRGPSRASVPCLLFCLAMACEPGSEETRTSLTLRPFPENWTAWRVEPVQVGWRDSEWLEMQLVLDVLGERPYPGASWQVVAPFAGLEWTYGPGASGSPALDPWPDKSEGVVHLPRHRAAFFKGLTGRSYLYPVTTLFKARSDEVELYRNTEEGASALVPRALHWVSRALAEELYDAAGRPLSEIDATATILGRPARWDAAREALVALDGYGAATLTLPDGSVLEATPLDDALQPTTAATASLFAFLGVPPADESAPYALTLEDRSGAPVPEYAQHLLPMAGGATVIAWEAEEP